MAERHTDAFAALSARTQSYGDRARAFNDDANKVVGNLLARVPRRAPAFAFLDPEGSELSWPTVQALAGNKQGASANKIEQLILLPTDMGFIRLIPDYPEKVTAMYGHDRWPEIERRRRTDELSADEARTEYVRLYASGLRDLGYATVLDRQIKKANGQPMYFLIFATDHSAGERIMDHCFDNVRLRVQAELGQAQLFPTKDAPRRRRLGED
jgi:three-Cys-motif partner protein